MMVFKTLSSELKTPFLGCRHGPGDLLILLTKASYRSNL